MLTAHNGRKRIKHFKIQLGTRTTGTLWPGTVDVNFNWVPVLSPTLHLSVMDDRKYKSGYKKQQLNKWNNWAKLNWLKSVYSFLSRIHASHHFFLTNHWTPTTKPPSPHTHTHAQHLESVRILCCCVLNWMFCAVVVTRMSSSESVMSSVKSRC